MKPYRQQHKPRPKKSALIYSRHKVMEALNSGVALERIYINHDLKGPEIEEINQAALKAQVPVNKVPEAKLRFYNVEGHQGVIALISKIQYQDVQDVVSQVIEKGEMPLLLILDGVTDIRNIGAIARTAYCCGVHAIIIPDKGVGALNEDAIETSAGALEKLSVCRVNSLMKTVDDLRLNGIKVYASEMTAKTFVYDLPMQEPTAIIMGSEDKGVYPALIKICDDQFKIPMVGDFESLNVSVATGMILYEAVKQRLK
ncbi:23S rRNA (guanosine(2251)-2'-O)-methyltransferase RlmB [Polluticaenibacter yanchengensis]|uniref:23S rRNA (Guanosine(2251)-2'-O)-methyltransferase RlmB n=1 Tax=Polluticaenibacter yanchengensis TaxID=3014562 RepID=A0ABT4UEM2_9BACT|nr:23S rRNA (guanosine(2251)-2'-O)-methyltransferase RlmB [Chitinophagaceae bacterium LY-5]